MFSLGRPFASGAPRRAGPKRTVTRHRNSQIHIELEVRTDLLVDDEFVRRLAVEVLPEVVLEGRR